MDTRHDEHTHDQRRNTWAELSAHFRKNHPEIPTHTAEYLHTLALPDSKFGKKRALQVEDGGDACLKVLTTNYSTSLSSDQSVDIFVRPNLQNHLYQRGEIENALATDVAWTVPADPRLILENSLAPGIPQDKSYVQYNPLTVSPVGTVSFFPCVYPSALKGRVLPAMASINVDNDTLASLPVAPLTVGPHLGVAYSGSTEIYVDMVPFLGAAVIDVQSLWVTALNSLVLSTLTPINNVTHSALTIQDKPISGIYCLGIMCTFRLFASRIETIQMSGFTGDGLVEISPGVERYLGWNGRPAGSGNDLETITNGGVDYYPVAMSLRVTWEASTLTGGSLGIASLSSTEQFATTDNCNLVSLSRLAVQKNNWNNSARKGGYATWLPTQKDFRYRLMRDVRDDGTGALAAQVTDFNTAVNIEPTSAIRIESVIWFCMRTTSEVFSPTPQINDPESVAAVINYLENVQRCYENPLHLDKVLSAARGFGKFLQGSYKVMRPMVRAVLHEASSRLPLRKETKDAIDQVEENFNATVIAPKKKKKKASNGNQVARRIAG